MTRKHNKEKKKKPQPLVHPDNRFTEQETIILVKKMLALENRVSIMAKQFEQIRIAINKAQMILVPSPDGLSLIPINIPKDPKDKIDIEVP